MNKHLTYSSQSNLFSKNFPINFYHKIRVPESVNLFYKTRHTYFSVNLNKHFVLKIVSIVLKN